MRIVYSSDHRTALCILYGVPETRVRGETQTERHARRGGAAWLRVSRV